MSTLTLRNLPTFLLSLILAYGAFSRFTHGAYTPTMYRYQTDRAPDDGSLSTAIVPIVDSLLAAFLLVPSQLANVTAAAAACMFTSIGVAMRILERGAVEARWDAALVGLAVVALWETLKRKR